MKKLGVLLLLPGVLLVAACFGIEVGVVPPTLPPGIGSPATTTPTPPPIPTPGPSPTPAWPARRASPAAT